MNSWTNKKKKLCIYRYLSGRIRHPTYREQYCDCESKSTRIFFSCVFCCWCAIDVGACLSSVNCSMFCVSTICVCVCARHNRETELGNFGNLSVGFVLASCVFELSGRYVNISFLCDDVRMVLSACKRFDFIADLHMSGTLLALAKRTSAKLEHAMRFFFFGGFSSIFVVDLKWGAAGGGVGWRAEWSVVGSYLLLWRRSHNNGSGDELTLEHTYTNVL